MSVTCGNCKKTHHSVEAVRRCYAGTAYPCGWQWEERDRFGVVYDENGPVIHECEALAWDTGRALVCEDGHEHVWEEARKAEGWDYVADADEARGLAMAGIRPVGMDGGSIAY